MSLNRWKSTLVVAAAALCFGASGCGSGVQGTYSSASGTMMLELRSGGKASFTLMGEDQDCSYKVGGKILHLNCGPHELDFRVADDGSLMSSAPFIAATYGVLKKAK